MDQRRILIVEDSPTMRQLLGFALRRLENVEIVEAQDGMDGLRKLSSDSYDLALIDIRGDIRILLLLLLLLIGVDFGFCDVDVCIHIEVRFVDVDVIEHHVRVVVTFFLRHMPIPLLEPYDATSHLQSGQSRACTSIFFGRFG